MKIQSITSDLFYIPLRVLTDSTHGVMEHFAAVTVRIRDNQGLEELGTLYVGKTGGALSSLCWSTTSNVCYWVKTPMRSIVFSTSFGGRCITSDVVGCMFAISAVDIALWDGSRGLNQPLWKFLGGVDDQVKAYAGVSMQLPIDRLEAQTQENLDRGLERSREVS